jgi:hypothetical protein
MYLILLTDLFEIGIQLHKAASFIGPVSFELLDTWETMVDQMRSLLFSSRNELENDAFMNGDGVNKPKGLLYMLEQNSGATLSVSTSGQIGAVDWSAALAGEERGLVEHGDEYDGASEPARAPALRPRAQQGRALVLIAVRGAVDHQHRPRLPAPDEGVEADAAGRREAEPVKSGGQPGQIVGLFPRSVRHGQT